MQAVSERPDTEERTEMREFLIVLRMALLQIVAYIERRYGLMPRHCHDCPLKR